MRRRLLIAVVMVLGVSIGAVGVPLLWLDEADELLDDVACVGPHSEDLPPEDAFYRAIEVLESVARFPGFEKRATDQAVHAGLQCMGAYSRACREVEDLARRHALKGLRAKRDTAMDEVSTAEARAAVVARAREAADALDDRTDLWGGSGADERARARFCAGWERFAGWLHSREAPVECVPCGGAGGE